MIGYSEQCPWGKWTVLDEGVGFKVKRIEVNPRSRLSYQTHEHRTEHWFVVSGTASPVLDGNTIVLKAGGSVDIAIEEAHRIVNDEDEPLIVIEIQRGDYLGEDDIVRLQDDYGRAAT